MGCCLSRRCVQPADSDIVELNPSPGESLRGPKRWQPMIATRPPNRHATVAVVGDTA